MIETSTEQFLAARYPADLASVRVPKKRFDSEVTSCRSCRRRGMKPDGHYLFPWITAEGWQIQLLTAQTPWASSPSSPAPVRFPRHFPMKAEAALAHPHAIRATIRAAFSAANFAFHMNDERACDSRYRGSAVILLHCGGRGGEPPGACARRNAISQSAEPPQ